MERREHIITLEDPIEYVLTQKVSYHAREVHTPHRLVRGGVARARSAKNPGRDHGRRDADLETISLAITAAETGHLVWNAAIPATLRAHSTACSDVFRPINRNKFGLW